MAGVDVWPWDSAMSEPFEIAGGASTRVSNVLVRVRLRGGAVGWGEGAPMPAYNGETQAAALKLLRAQRGFLLGKDAGRWRPLLERLDERLGGAGAARAALSMALLDAWSRQARLPLGRLFGGAQTRLRSDVTVAIVGPAQAKAAARRIVARGIFAIKVKVGKDLDDDEERVRAVAAASSKLTLILDANQGYAPRQSIALLKRLKRRGLRPALFEQPAAKDDWDGLAEVHAATKVPVAADESVASRDDALRMARHRGAQVVNIKLMKCGLLEAWDIALICRAAGLGLMMGGNVESYLAMTAAAHLAGGLGGFSFIDLDTPLWFAKDPTRGMRLQHGGVYDLSKVRAGIGVTPIRP